VRLPHKIAECDLDMGCSLCNLTASSVTGLFGQHQQKAESSVRRGQGEVAIGRLNVDHFKGRNYP